MRATRKECGEGRGLRAPSGSEHVRGRVQAKGGDAPVSLQSKLVSVQPLRCSFRNQGGEGVAHTSGGVAHTASPVASRQPVRIANCRRFGNTAGGGQTEVDHILVAEQVDGDDGEDGGDDEEYSKGGGDRNDGCRGRRGSIRGDRGSLSGENPDNCKFAAGSFVMLQNFQPIGGKNVKLCCYLSAETMCARSNNNKTT